jgi:hypothetical protein
MSSLLVPKRQAVYKGVGSEVQLSVGNSRQARCGQDDGEEKGGGGGAALLMVTAPVTCGKGSWV